MTSLFTEFEEATEAPRAKPKPVTVTVPKDTAEPPPPRKRLSYWSLPEIDAAIADLRRDREEHWDCLIPAGVLGAARLLPTDGLAELADYLLGELADLRTRIVEDNSRATS